MSVWWLQNTRFLNLNDAILNFSPEPSLWLSQLQAVWWGRIWRSIEEAEDCPMPRSAWHWGAPPCRHRCPPSWPALPQSAGEYILKGKSCQLSTERECWVEKCMDGFSVSWNQVCTSALLMKWSQQETDQSKVQILWDGDSNLDSISLRAKEQSLSVHFCSIIRALKLELIQKHPYLFSRSFLLYVLTNTLCIGKKVNRFHTWTADGPKLTDFHTIKQYWVSCDW